MTPISKTSADAARTHLVRCKGSAEDTILLQKLCLHPPNERVGASMGLAELTVCPRIRLEFEMSPERVQGNRAAVPVEARMIHKLEVRGHP